MISTQASGEIYQGYLVFARQLPGIPVTWFAEVHGPDGGIRQSFEELASEPEGALAIAKLLVDEEVGSCSN